MKPARMIVAVGSLACALAVPGFADDEAGQEIKLSDCPAAVQKTLHAESRGAKIGAVTKDVDDGKTTYSASVVIGGKSYGIEVDETGTLTELCLEVDDDDVKFADCPAAVQKTFREEAKQAAIDVVGKDLQYGVTVFSARVTLGGKEYEVVVAEDGTLVEKTLVIEEDDIELSECPAAVQTTFHDAAPEGTIGAVSRSTGIGGHVYEAEVKIDGKDYLLEVTERGMLVSKALDDDSEE